MKYTFISLLILTSILMLLIPSVSADAITPPKSITIYGYIMSHNQTGIWFIQPSDIDLNGTQIWYDNVYQMQTNSTAKFYYKEFLSSGEHTFSTHTIDNTGNVNSTWVNLTIEVVYGECSEDWFFDEWCSGGVLKCVALFIMNQSVGYPPLGVQFTDISTGSPSSWNWSFGDGNYSTDQNPTYIFSQENVYNITLTVYNGNNTDTIFHNVYALNITLGGTSSSGTSTTSLWIDANTMLAFSAITIPAVLIMVYLLVTNRRREDE